VRSSKLSSPWVYFALVYIFSWGFTIPAALSGASLRESPTLMVIYGLGGLGPAVSAILLHFMQNFTGELFELSARAELYSFLLTIVAAMLVVVIWRSRTLCCKGAP